MLLSIGSVLNGKYRVVRELGRGGMGVVYQAEHLLLKSLVAVKMLAPEFVANEQLRERFFKEARTQSALRHPSVNRVVDYFEQDRHLFLVLEFVEGDPLTTLLEAGPLPQAQSVHLITCILEGLDYVHRQGVIHRDVKPSNVLVDAAGRAVLIDFGIAVRAGGTRVTRAGGRVGSAHYMSPEQIQQPQNLDHRIDIYAAGVVLYEMLTGRVPFDGGSDYEIERQQIGASPPDPRKLEPSISPHVAKAVLKALEKDPGRRHQSCLEFIAALSETSSASARRTTSTRNVGWVLTGVLAVLAIGYLVSIRDATVTLRTSDTGSASPATSQPSPAKAPAADSVGAMAEIPTDQVLSIESMALYALEEMKKYCAWNAERDSLSAMAEKAPVPGRGRQHAGEIRRLDADIRTSQREFLAAIDGLRGHPKASVAQLLAERRREAFSDDARRLSAIERRLADDASAAAKLSATDCDDAGGGRVAAPP